MPQPPDAPLPSARPTGPTAEPGRPDSLPEEAPGGLPTTIVHRGGFLARSVRSEGPFLGFIVAAFAVAALVHPVPGIAMWVGFFLAGYAVVANDSIQTIGTFLQSNRHRPWWVLWLFVGGVFLATVTYSWLNYGGDVSYARLQSKGFSETPTSYTFLELAAPIFLLILTRLRMPVSTSVLILSTFATTPAAIGDMLTKSLSGYVVAIVLGIVVWYALTRALRGSFRGQPAAFWTPLQWISTGFLWSSWVMQDAANVAVYLPRSMSFGQFLAFAGFIFAGLGVLFWSRGGRIQHVIASKADVVDVRQATVIDFVYGVILFVFKELSSIPMSTTWVFIGLLAGREIAMSLGRRHHNLARRPLRYALRLAGKDVLYAGIGLGVSILLALATNSALLEGLR